MAGERAQRSLVPAGMSAIVVGPLEGLEERDSAREGEALQAREGDVADAARGVVHHPPHADLVARGGARARRYAMRSFTSLRSYTLLPPMMR